VVWVQSHSVPLCSLLDVRPTSDDRRSATESTRRHSRSDRSMEVLMHSQRARVLRRLSRSIGPIHVRIRSTATEGESVRLLTSVSGSLSLSLSLSPTRLSRLPLLLLNRSSSPAPTVNRSTHAPTSQSQPVRPRHSNAQFAQSQCVVALHILFRPDCIISLLLFLLLLLRVRSPRQIPNSTHPNSVRIRNSSRQSVLLCIHFRLTHSESIERVFTPGSIALPVTRGL
jgi:hypothetical protein